MKTMFVILLACTTLTSVLLCQCARHDPLEPQQEEPQ